MLKNIRCLDVSVNKTIKSTPSIQNGSWVQHWAGPWSLLSCSYFGTYYTHTVAEFLETRIPRCVITSQKGQSACYFPKDELDSFGKELAEQVEKNPEKAKQWANELKTESDTVRAVLKKLGPKTVRLEVLACFEAALRNYTAPHLAVKKVVDYLPAAMLKKMLPELEDARLYSETVYDLTEKYVKKAVAQIAEKSGRSKEQIEALTYKELNEYFQSGKLPNPKTLAERFNNAALVFKQGDFVVLQGKSAKSVEKQVRQPASSNTVLGKCAYPGKATGLVRIVRDPSRVKEFDAGDILVASMTRPEYVPLFEKAAAVITDAGGILSHAAIVARELKKPCIIGTLTATKRLKDGDLVSVDARNGVAKVMPKK